MQCPAPYVVYRSIPTSNRNHHAQHLCVALVVYRSIPTSNRNPQRKKQLRRKLYIVLFLHQTATQHVILLYWFCCISFYSYIKPQLSWLFLFCAGVVYRSIPTSNRNHDSSSLIRLQVVYRSIPTSNRNLQGAEHVPTLVVYRSIPTSNRNQLGPVHHADELYIVLFLHQTATTTHHWHCLPALYIVLFLHQTATSWVVCEASR